MSRSRSAGNSSCGRAALEAGTIRPGLGSPDVLVMLTGIALAAGRPGQREQAERRLDLALDGMCTGVREPGRRPAAPVP